MDTDTYKWNDLIVGVYPKGRELKIKGRLFAMLTFPVRTYFLHGEMMLKKCPPTNHDAVIELLKDSIGVANVATLGARKGQHIFGHQYGFFKMERLLYPI